MKVQVILKSKEIVKRMPVGFAGKNRRFRINGKIIVCQPHSICKDTYVEM